MMDETMNEKQHGKGGSKKLLAFVIAAVLIIGGAFAAYAFLNKSAKTKYFLAEKESVEHVVDHLAEQYEPEWQWYDQSQEKPTKTNTEITGNYESPYGSLPSGGMFNPEDLVNNAKLKFSTQTDMKNEQASLTMNASMGDIETGDISGFLTAHKLGVQLPFLDELLQVKDNDLSKLLKEADATFDSNDINFSDFFQKGSLPDKDLKYLEKEYLNMIYKELPDDSFESTDEKIDVNGKSVKAEKITMHLTEKQIKDILSHLFTKAAKDKKLMKILEKQMEMQQFGMGLNTTTSDLDALTNEMAENFAQAMKDADKGLKDIKIPDGLTSTIWVKDKLIAKRDLSFKIGPDKEQLVTLGVKGTQALEKEKQEFDYTFSYKNQFNDGNLKLNGSLSNKNGKINNDIKIAVADIELAYNADETLKDGKRDFERKLSFSGNGEKGGLTWSGDANYDKDQMTSNHKLALDGDFLEGMKVGINFKNNAKIVKKVELPKEDNVKDLGNMNLDEIEQYFTNEVVPKAQQYVMKLIGPGF